jgi:transcription elongation factor Elf1
MKTEKEITPEMQKRYIETGYNNCPFCGSDDISADHPDTDTCITVDVECNGCGEEWREEYALTGITKQ